MYNEQIKLCQAIVELDEKLSEKGITPFTLNVCGGFALLLQNVRKDVESYTDIDYIGSDLSKDIQEEVINIGYKHGFGNDWINNDILLSGSTLEELEYATGKLHFEPKMQLKVITVTHNINDCAEELMKINKEINDTLYESNVLTNDFYYYNPETEEIISYKMHPELFTELNQESIEEDMDLE